MNKHSHSPPLSDAAGKADGEISTRSLLVGGALFLGLLTLLFLMVRSIGLETLQQAVAGAGILGPLVFIGIKALTFTVAPLTAGPIQFASGVLFGVVEGTLYSLAGEVLGGTANVLIARVFGRRIVERFVGSAAMAKVDGFYERYLDDWRSLLAARVLLFSVYDFISYAVGFGRISVAVYVAVSFIGGLIPTYIFVRIGAEASQNQNVLLLLYAGTAVVFVIFVLLRRPISRWVNRLQKEA